MASRIKALCISFALIAGYASTVAAQTPRLVEPVQAVQLAAATRPYGFSGVFSLTVRSISTRGAFTFLNSELDERDIRNLSVAIPAKTVQKLQTQYGPVEAAFLGKTILVSGVAKQVPVSLLHDGKRTISSFLQTTVRASDPKKIRFVAGGS